MKVAVTGATGFIGRHVLSELETRSVKSIALLRPSTAKALDHSRCSIVQFDLHNAPPNAFELMGCRERVEGWIKENGWSIRLNLGFYPYPDYEPMAFWGNPQKLSSLIGDAT